MFLFNTEIWPTFATTLCMILMIWSSERARDYALSIEHAVQEKVEIVSNLHEACDAYARKNFLL